MLDNIFFSRLLQHIKMCFFFAKTEKKYESKVYVEGKNLLCMQINKFKES